MNKWVIVFLVCVGVLLSGADAQSTNQLRQELQRIKDDYKNDMKKIWEDIKRLEKDQSDTKVKLEADFDATVKKYLEESGKDPIAWKDIISAPNKIKFYGFLRLDMVYDNHRTNAGNTAAFVLNRATTNADEELNIHARSTRFGFDLVGGKLSTLGNPELSGKLEIDFHGGGSESNNAIRMRHAYLKLNWSDYDLSLLAGQTADIASPLIPETIDVASSFRDVGNTGDRRPQLRIEWSPAIIKGTKEDETRLFFTVGILRAGAVDGLDTDADGNNDGEDSGAPMVQGRMGIATPGWVEGQKIRFGMFMSHAWYDTQTPIGIRGEREFVSHFYGIDLVVPITERVEFSTEWWWGYNVADLRGGIAQGRDAVKGDEIEAFGGWFNLKVKTSDRSTLALGYLVDNPVDGDIAPGGRLMNEAYFINNVWDLTSGVSAGVEYQYFRTRYTRRDFSNYDSRFIAFIQYKF